MSQDEVLNQELYIAYAAVALFEIEVCFVAAIQFVAHAYAHVHHILMQRIEVHATANRFRANALELQTDVLTPGNMARAQQCLMLPGPGIFFLVALERFRARNK